LPHRWKQTATRQQGAFRCRCRSPKPIAPPLPIEINPLLGNAAALVTVSVPPLIVVPPV